MTATQIHLADGAASELNNTGLCGACWVRHNRKRISAIMVEICTSSWFWFQNCPGRRYRLVCSDRQQSMYKHLPSPPFWLTRSWYAIASLWRSWVCRSGTRRTVRRCFRFRYLLPAACLAPLSRWSAAWFPIASGGIRWRSWSPAEPA